MKANRKFVEGEEAVSAVIGVILMVAITVAIAATVYVYVTGIVPTSTQTTENAAAVAKIENNLIRVTLASGGQNYGDGYTDFTVFVDGTQATVADTTWIVGEGYVLGYSGTKAASAFEAGAATTIAAGDYAITVSVLDTVIFDGSITQV